ncbi:hypothetical protein [Novacetimonas pomaceti]|uniref:hypothetical protein n=1 Tax=Novacetimonas pomaceti TaxID=2021998 RepID=UPI0014029846|nr:hypothetical protein [Novacetimonas pomaceti]
MTAGDAWHPRHLIPGGRSMATDAPRAASSRHRRPGIPAARGVLFHVLAHHG